LLNFLQAAPRAFVRKVTGVPDLSKAQEVRESDGTFFWGHNVGCFTLASGWPLFGSRIIFLLLFCYIGSYPIPYKIKPYLGLIVAKKAAQIIGNQNNSKKLTIFSHFSTLKKSIS
jgi:hypothetical protein